MPRLVQEGQTPDGHRTLPIEEVEVRSMGEGLVEGVASDKRFGYHLMGATAP
jgi:hypothetical protein